MDATAIVGGALGLAGSLWSSDSSAEAAAAQIAFQREAMQHRYQWTMADLKKAGLNPMLAVGGLSQGVPSGAMAHYENPGTAAVQSAAAAKAMELSERQQHNQDIQAQSVVNVNNAQASKVEAETLNEYDKHSAGYWSSQSDLAGASASYQRENINNLYSQRQLIAQQMKESDSRIATLTMDLQNMQKEREYTIAKIRQSGMESAESATRSSLNQINAKLAQTEQALTIERTKTQKFQTMAADFDAQARHLGLAKSKEDAYWYNNPVGKLFERTGHMIRNISPFNFAK